MNSVDISFYFNIFFGLFILIAPYLVTRYFTQAVGIGTIPNSTPQKLVIVGMVASSGALGHIAFKGFCDFFDAINVKFTLLLDTSTLYSYAHTIIIMIYVSDYVWRCSTKLEKKVKKKKVIERELTQKERMEIYEEMKKKIPRSTETDFEPKKREVSDRDQEIMKKVEEDNLDTEKN